MNAIATLPAPRRPPLLDGVGAAAVGRRSTGPRSPAEERAFVTEVARGWAAAAIAPIGADPAEAERAVREIYALAGLPPPATLWAATPCAGAVAAVALDARSPEAFRRRCRTAWGHAPAPRAPVWPLLAERVISPVTADLTARFGTDQGHLLHLESLVGTVFAEAGLDRRQTLALRHVDDVVTGTVVDWSGTGPGGAGDELDAWLDWRSGVEHEAPGPGAQGRLDCAPVALFDVLHQVGWLDGPFPAAAARLARSCLTWWPFDDVVVLASGLDVPGGPCAFEPPPGLPSAR